MTRVYLLVEGQTEEAFVRELLAPHYSRMGLYLAPIVFRTSPGHSGGVVSYGKVKTQLLRLCKQDATAFVSTLIDLYALPGDFPGMSDVAFPKHGSGRDKALYIEDRFARDIGLPNFIPNLLVHEFEALLFVQPEKFSEWVDDESVADTLSQMAATYLSPEDINDGRTTAPSKRIRSAMPSYRKTLHGPLIACDIGLDAMRRVCPHFHAWLERLEALVR